MKARMFEIFAIAILLIALLASVWVINDKQQEHNRLEVQVANMENEIATLASTHTPTPTPTTTPTPTSTSTPTPTFTPIPTNTRWPTNTPIPTSTLAPTPTPGDDPEQAFYDGIDVMCRAGNGMVAQMMLEMLGMPLAPFDCNGIVTGGKDLGWYSKPDFHKTATPLPTSTPE